MTKDYKKKQKKYLVGAILLLLIGLAGLSTFFESYELSDLFLALIVFILPGGWCASKWYKGKNKFQEYEKYLDYIKARKRVSIDNLCNKFGVDFDYMTTIASEMISNGLINGYLTDDEIILNGAKNIDVKALDDRIIKNRETKVVKCRECGAKNTVVVGERHECDYCGTMIE